MERTAGADRRDSEIVRQTAELLSLGIPLSELFERFCLLLAEFVDASVVFIAIASERGTHIEFAYDHGSSLRDAHIPITPDSQSQRVMQSGQSVLFRDPWDIPKQRVPLPMPWGVIEDTESAMFVPLRFGAQTIGVLSVQTYRGYAYDRSDLQLLETCALYVAVAVQAESMRAQKERAEAVATLDPVTGTATRRVFDERLQHDWNTARRTGEAVAVILMDIDRFKAFNDTYGHVAGDSCLAQVAQAAGATISRESDLFARYGGEEFAAILRNVAPEEAVGIAERMRKAVSDLQIPHAASDAGIVTASFGIASSAVTGEDPRALLRTADRALYAAKTAGRNRSCLQGRQVETQSYVVAGNLPMPATPFIGRKIELDALSRSLAVSRLTTILGPAGVGKTSCALAVARQLLNAYAHGIWFVDLGAVHDAGDLAAAVCQALRVPHAAYRTPFDAVMEYLKEKHCLLILDNCEQVAQAAADFCELVLDGSTRTTIVVTSREPLKAPHERLFYMSTLTRHDAEALFCERAGAAFPGIIFDAAEREGIHDICDRLDNLPLAIALAAPRTKTMSVAQLTTALEDRFEILVSAQRALPVRQRTLEAAIDWSYGLLDRRGQRLFERLAVFAGNFDADAARDVCSFSPLRPGEAAAAFDEAVEKNLVAPAASSGEERFALLESMREYAATRLRERGEFEDTARRHIAYYLSLARRISEQLARDGGEHALALAGREWPEFQAALERAICDELDLQAGLDLVLALRIYWVHAGRAREARTWTTRALEKTPPEASQRYDVLHAATVAAQTEGDFIAHRALATELLDLAKDSGDPVALGRAHTSVGNAEFHLGNAAETQFHYERALAFYREAGNRRGVGVVLMNLGSAAGDLHMDFSTARERFLEALSIFRELGVSADIANVLANLGEASAQIGDLEPALRYASEALAIYERIGNRGASTWQLINLAHYHLERREWAEASAALHQAYEMLQEHVYRDNVAAFFEVGFYFAVDIQRFDLAARLAGYLESYRTRESVPRLPNAKRHFEPRVERVRAALGVTQYEERFTAGAQMRGEDLASSILRF
jgi:diguanylate cyclase (GGDEF)-like protein